MQLGLAEWTVLALLAERPAHGFAIAALTAPDGELGRVWQLPRPVVYRALGRLVEVGLAERTATESGPGPQRTVHAATASGRAAVRDWLHAPVAHVRDLRSHLLVKLVLLDRRGEERTGLALRQLAVLAPIADGLRRAPAGDLLPAWRRATASAALDFLDELAGPVVLFSYGTLRRPEVQLATFGRHLAGRPDRLPGHTLSLLEITDPGVLAISGSAHHPVVRPTGDPADTVDGTAFQITARELVAADEYEVDDYVRTAVTLASGMTAWAYVARS